MGDKFILSGGKTTKMTQVPLEKFMQKMEEMKLTKEFDESKHPRLVSLVKVQVLTEPLNLLETNKVLR